MIYGIISNLDDATTSAYFRNKKVTEERIFHTNQLSTLLSVLRSGDVVHVVHINRFATVSQFLVFGRFCMSNGVSLHVLAQPYLDLGNGRQWREAVIRQMMRMVEVERQAKAHMVRGFKMGNEQWDYVYNCFERMNIESLAGIFDADGILKRGS